MSISRRDLYAAGEPFGESATRAKPGGGYVCGGGGGGSSSSSSNATTTTTYTTDKRMVVDQGIGITSDSSTVHVESMDAGIVNKALDTVAAADATAGEGFMRLLGLADKLFEGAGSMIETTQATALAATQTAANDAKGAVDQKTIIILAGAAVAAFAFMRKG